MISLHQAAILPFERGDKPTLDVEDDQRRSVCFVTALSMRECGMESKKARMSRSITQSFFQHRFRHVATASRADRPGR